MLNDWREDRRRPVRLYDQNVLYPLLREEKFGGVLLTSIKSSLSGFPDSTGRVASLVSTVMENLGVLPVHPKVDIEIQKKYDDCRNLVAQVAYFAENYYRDEAKRLMGLLKSGFRDKRNHCLKSRLDIFEACMGSLSRAEFEDTLRFHLLHDYVTKFNYSKNIENEVFGFLADQCFLISQKVGRNASSFRLVKRIWDSSYPFYSRKNHSEDVWNDAEACNKLMRLKERRDFLDCDIVHLAVFGIFDREERVRYPIHAFTKDGAEDVKLRIRLLKGMAESRRRFVNLDSGGEIPDDLVSRMNGLILFVGDDGSISKILDVEKECDPLIVVR